MRGVELLLLDLILDNAQRGWFWEGPQSFLLQLFQCFHVDVLDLDGQAVQLPSKVQDSIMVADISLDKMVTEMGRWALFIVFHYPCFHGVISRFLQQHPAQLPTTQYASFDHFPEYIV
jgi:hypothetical protein